MKPVSRRISRRAFLHGASSSLAGIGGITAQASADTPPASQAVSYKRGERGYEELRRALIWQAIKPPRYPDRIVEVTSAGDVTAAIASAKAERRRISIVSCGHSYVGNGIQDDVVLLHLGNLQEVSVDKAAHTASLQPGIRAFPFDVLLHKHGLAFPVPHNPTVGMAGFLLGGGMGWNAESWNNFACFNVRSVEAVLASGEAVLADDQQHADLFWAARGAGPYFPAVATRFHVDVFPQPAAIRESTLVYSMSAAPEVIAWLERAHAAQDPKMELTLIFGMSDPEDNNGKTEPQCIVSSICFANSEAEAKQFYHAIAKDAPTADLIFKEELQPRSIGDLLLEDKASLPNRHAVETYWTSKPAKAAQILAGRFPSSPTPTTLLYVNYRARPFVPPGGIYSSVGSAFVFSDVSWAEEHQDEACRKWSDELVASLAGVDNAAYINETEIVRHPNRVMHCFSKQNWQRLTQIIAKYDPSGLFSSPPTA
jgi:FAD/FMN-containing dehydrogenase